MSNNTETITGMEPHPYFDFFCNRVHSILKDVKCYDESGVFPLTAIHVMKGFLMDVYDVGVVCDDNGFPSDEIENEFNELWDDWEATLLLFLSGEWREVVSNRQELYPNFARILWKALLLAADHNCAMNAFKGGEL